MTESIKRANAANQDAFAAQLPPGFQLRAPTLADVPSTVAMFNASAIDTIGTPQFSEAELDADWQEPGFNLATDGRVIVTADNQVVGSADVIFRPPYVRNFIWARVHPDYRGRGFGTLLTQWAEARIQERIADAPADARITIGSQNIASHQAATTLLANLGYAHVRSFYSMKIEMASPPPLPQWPAGITIRTMIPGQDEAELYRAKDDAFRDHWGYVETPFAEGFAFWLHHIKHDPDHDPTLYFMAMVQDTEHPADEQVAGYAFCMPTTTDDPDMGWIDSLGVRRPWRRQGLALALLHHIFGEFYRRGIKKVGLGVDASSLTGATRLYERAGMQPFRQYNTYEKELRPGHDLTTQVAGG